MSDDGPGTREVAHRLFAAEFDDASLSYSESDEERAPNYVVTPTGARVNRLFVAGVLTEVERVNDRTSRGRVVDPSGAFVTYAGQYQPDEQAFLERVETPAFVALTGKARTFEPEDSDRVFTSVRPESVSEVDAGTRDRWVVSAAEATLDRLAVLERALDSDLRGEELRSALEAGGAPASLAVGIPKAIAHYDTSPAYIEAVRRLAVDALELIAGERDDVRAPEIAPDADNDATVGPLPETDVRIEPTVAVGGGEPSADPAATPDESSPATPATAEPLEGGTGDAVDAADAVDVADESDAVDVADETGDPAGVDGSGDSEALGESDGSSGTDDGTGLGDFDADETEDGRASDGEAVDSDSEPTAPDTADGMYELDEAEREEIESEFGTDFATGSEVDEPGEADIDVPGPDGPSEDGEAGEGDGPAAVSDDDGSEPAVDVDDGSGDDGSGGEGDDGSGGEGDDAVAPDDVDLEAAAVEEMDALDDGDGADREAVVEAVAAEYGVDPEAVEDAVQDALMGGKCYEPGDGLLKAI
ncbi:hypothetical protein DQW50_10335 [Halorubrum sp. 48-1-W]|uniref:hypothetical protein n=1 Tax=Halorubrum sp. 48-1-W TaxID=2249761 RepID=UPI000DCCE35E|nr:hypothetical protein [Halorubrum sp. 48-1-W]RAW45192.1 hypothetical protein DQW50_10335 [Halorubrum sp. 48-1-W]